MHAAQKLWVRTCKKTLRSRSEAAMSHALDKAGRWIGWAFFADLANGLALTFGYMFSKPVTDRKSVV